MPKIFACGTMAVQQLSLNSISNLRFWRFICNWSEEVQPFSYQKKNQELNKSFGDPLTKPRRRRRIFLLFLPPSGIKLWSQIPSLPPPVRKSWLRPCASYNLMRQMSLEWRQIFQREWDLGWETFFSFGRDQGMRIFFILLALRECFILEFGNQI